MIFKLIAFFLCCVCLVACSEEASPEVVEQVPFWWKSLLEIGQALVLTIFGGLSSLFVYWLNKKAKLDSAEKEAVESLKVAVNDTFETYVRAIKEGAADRKLTEKERTAAMNRTLVKAREVASSEALEVFKSKGEDWMKAKVEHWLLILKGKVFGSKKD